MGRHRVISAIVIAGVLVVAAGAADGAAPPPPRTGHAEAVVTLPRVVVTDPSGVTHSVDLGTLGAGAVTDTGPLASLGLRAAALLGTPLPGWQVDSSGGPVSGDHQVPLTDGAVTGALQLLGYDVDATAGAARARLAALTGTVTTTPVEATVALGQHGVDARTTATSSIGAVDVTVSGLRLALGDLVPADVLAGLPLPTLLALASTVGMSLPSGAAGVETELTGVVADLRNVADAAAAVAQAQQSLDDLLASLPATAAAQQQLDDAQSQLATDLASLQAAQQKLAADTATEASLTAQVASLTTQLANPLLTPFQLAQLQLQLADAQQQLVQVTSDTTADQTLVTSLQQQVTTDQAAVTTAQQSLDALVATLSGNTDLADAQALVTQLTATLAGLVTQLTDAIHALPDLGALTEQLRAGLAGAPLLDVGSVGASLDASADDSGGSGTVSCRVTGAMVLGQPIPVGACSDLVARFADVRHAVDRVLSRLSVSGVSAPVLDGLVPETSGAAAAADDVSTAGSAGLSPLHLALPGVTVGSLTDPVHTQLVAALDAADQQLIALGSVTVTDALTGPLADLAAAAGSLPTGAGLSGLRTVGLDVSLVGLRAAATYHRSAPSTAGGSGNGGAGGGAAAGVQGSPGASGSDPHPPSTHNEPVDPPADRTTEASPAPRLPFTGSDAAREAAAALLLVLVGGHLVVVGRRQRAS